MSLSFTNPTRTYDERRGVIRFIGHDGLNQVVFLLPVALLDQGSYSASLREQTYLSAFDRLRSRILDIARTRYERNNRSMVELDSAAIGSALRPTS